VDQEVLQVLAFLEFPVDQEVLQVLAFLEFPVDQEVLRNHLYEGYYYSKLGTILQFC
jgi:hypothetical protein